MYPNTTTQTSTPPLAQGTLKMVPPGTMGTKTVVPGGVNTPVKNTTPTPAPASQQQVGSTNPQLDALKKTALGIQSSLNDYAQQQQSKTPTFPGAVGDLIQQAQKGSPAAQDYTKKTADYGAGSIDVGQRASDIANYYQKQIEGLSPTFNEAQGALTSGAAAPIALGNSSALYNAATNRMNTLQSAEQAALAGTGQQLTAQNQAANAANEAAGQATTGQGQTITGLSNAGNLSQPSGNYPFAFDPLSRGFTQSGSGSQITPQQAAQSVKSGQMTPEQAQNALAYLGSSSQSQLYGAMQQVDPGFNWNQATVNAQTQGALAPQGNLASQELQNLQNVISTVPGWQATSIPAINAITNLFSGVTGVGLQSRQELTNAINAVRGSVSTALGTAYNTTPTAFTGMVNEWFPDNPTPSQVQAGVQQFNTLMSARASSFQSPGTTQLPTTGASNLWSW